MRRFWAILTALAGFGVGVAVVQTSAADPVEHVIVQRGDSWATIATRCSSTPASLRIANGLSSSAAVPAVGRVLHCVPGAPPATTTSTSASTTTTTAPAPVTTTAVVGSPSPGCGLTDAAFCDTFDTARPVGGTRSGDLDPEFWGVSRISSAANASQGQLNSWHSSTLVGCPGAPVAQPSGDVRICGGRLVEAVDDAEGQTTLAMYPKQPFDIAGRTGTVVFDVSADSQGVHAAWPEFWWTDQPLPAPMGGVSALASYARNSFGFSLAGCGGNQTGVDKIQVTRSYRIETVPLLPGGGCVAKGDAATGRLNHFEVRISETHVEVWGTDPGSTILKLLAAADVAMPLTRGVIWIEDVHYNACKFDQQCKHSFVWDNVGFDGPTPYRDLTFDVPDAGTNAGGGWQQLGYNLWNNTGNAAGLTLTAKGVTWEQTPTRALIGFNWFAQQTVVPQVRVNGGPWHDLAWPFDEQTYVWRTIAIEIPFAEIKAGDNRVEFRTSDQTVVANINVILIAAAPV